MAKPKLFTPQLPSLQVAFSDLKQQALEQVFLLAGTPGSVTKRDVNGSTFYYRQYYDAQQRKAAEYIGPVNDAAASKRAEEIQHQIETANALLEVARLLSRAGYVRVDARTDAVLTAIANNDLFRAGALLVGSHAYGAILNELGARTAGYATEDIDIARARALDLRHSKSFEAILAESMLPLHPIPQLDRRKPPTSFKAPGADRLRVDLLMPTGGDAVKVMAVHELQSHATALPYLRYLLMESMDAVVLGRSAVIPVRVPRPERFAWHKMLISELRARTSDKKAKDIEQAASLFAILAEREPGAVEEAFRELPRTMQGKTKDGAKRVLVRLEESQHGQAAEVLRDLLG